MKKVEDYRPEEIAFIRYLNPQIKPETVTTN